MITRDWSQVQKSAHLKKCTQGVRNKGSLTGIFFFSSLFLFFREAIGRVKRVCDRLLTAYKEYEHLLRLRNTFKGHVSWNKYTRLAIKRLIIHWLRILCVKYSSGAV